MTPGMPPTSPSAPPITVDTGMDSAERSADIWFMWYVAPSIIIYSAPSLAASSGLELAETSRYRFIP